MGLMARAARMAARQGREAISEDDIYAAMENKAMEAYAVSMAQVQGEWEERCGGSNTATTCCCRKVDVVLAAAQHVSVLQASFGDLHQI